MAHARILWYACLDLYPYVFAYAEIQMPNRLAFVVTAAVAITREMCRRSVIRRGEVFEL